MNTKTNTTSVLPVTTVFYKANRMQSRVSRVEHLVQAKGESFVASRAQQIEHNRKVRNQERLHENVELVQEKHVYQDCFNTRVLTGNI